MAVPEEIQEKVLDEAMSVTPNFSTDYNDPQFKNVDDSIAKQETELNETYGGIINSTDKYYNDLKDATQQWADKQSQIQQENTDFAIEKIEQEKDKAHKDYVKEQSGAYVDWRKQSNQYGSEAEKMASAGLTNTGYSESSQVSMYNTYQNRVATARESYNYAVLNYNNAIKEAQLQNNAALAEIAYQALEKQLTLTLEGFQYKNSLVLELAGKKSELENIKWNRYQDVLQQMNTEKQLAWDAWQYNDNKAWQTEQNELDHKRQLERDEINNKFSAAQAELDRKHEIAMFNAKTKAEKEAADLDYKRQKELLAQQHKNDLAKIDKQLAADKALYSYQKSQSGGSSQITGGSSGSKWYSNAKSSSTNKTKVTNTSSSKAKSTGASIGKATGSGALTIDQQMDLLVLQGLIS